MTNSPTNRLNLKIRKLSQLTAEKTKFSLEFYGLADGQTK